MRAMIIREWTDPENSMHPGLDYWREPWAVTSRTGRLSAENISTQSDDRAGRAISEEQTTANGEDRHHPLSASINNKSGPKASSGPAAA
jgi:hypothetical protein